MIINRNKIKNRINFGSCNFTVIDGMDSVEMLNYNDMFKKIGDAIKTKSITETDGAYIIGKDIYDYPESYTIEFMSKYGSRIYSNLSVYIYSLPEKTLVNILKDNNVYTISLYELFNNSEIYKDNTCYVTNSFISSEYKETVGVGFYELYGLRPSFDYTKCVLTESEIENLKDIANALYVSYTLTDNTDATEVITDTTSTVHTGTTTKGTVIKTTNNLIDTDSHANTITRTDNLTEKNTGTDNVGASSVTENKTFGYNSSDAIPDNTSSTTGSNNNTKDLTVSNTGTQTNADNGSGSTLHTGDITVGNTGSDSDNYTDTITLTHNMHKHGNIGVTTNQEMLTEELKLRTTTIIDTLLNKVTNKILSKVY